MPYSNTLPLWVFSLNTILLEKRWLLVGIYRYVNKSLHRRPLKEIFGHTLPTRSNHFKMALNTILTFLDGMT